MTHCARFNLLLLAALCVAASGELPAREAISRCSGENGVPVFTDRSCSALGVPEYVAPPEVLPDVPLPVDLPTPVRGCSREVDTLETWVRAALESGDVNDFAGLYHWADATVYTAEKVMPGLQEVSRRPLIDIETESAYFEGVYQPVRLWLDQYDPARPGKTIRTGFSLVLNAGCWWLHS